MPESASSTPATVSSAPQRKLFGLALPARGTRGRGKGEARRLAIDAGPTWVRAIACERAGGRITIVRGGQSISVTFGG